MTNRLSLAEPPVGRIRYDTQLVPAAPYRCCELKRPRPDIFMILLFRRGNGHYFLPRDQLDQVNEFTSVLDLILLHRSTELNLIKKGSGLQQLVLFITVSSPTHQLTRLAQHKGIGYVFTDSN
jgi:hypothetical protein